MNTDKKNNRTTLFNAIWWFDWFSHLVESTGHSWVKHGDRTTVTALETKFRVREEVLLAYYTLTLRLFYTDINNKVAFLPLIANFSIHLHHWQFTNRSQDNKLNIYLPTNPFSPTNLRAILSAKTEEFPCAMLAKGPAWTNTGVPWMIKKNM